MTDTFRIEYKPLTKDQLFHVDVIKYAAEDLLMSLNQTRTVKQIEINERMMDIAKTNLEQAIMWAIKAIT